MSTFKLLYDIKSKIWGSDPACVSNSLFKQDESMFELSDKEFEAVQSLNDEYRESYFWQKAFEHGIIYALEDPKGGPLMIEDEGDMLLPLWCHERFALAFMQKQSLQTKVLRIKRSDFMQVWLPSLSAHGVHLAFMPVWGKEDDISFVSQSAEDLLKEQNPMQDDAAQNQEGAKK